MLAAGALTIVPTACSNPSDAEVFGATRYTIAPDDSVTDVVPSSSTDSPTTTTATTLVTTTVPTTTHPVAIASAIPAGAEMIIDFTYSASGGRVRNPYVAVWVEDTDGNMVSTIYVWYQRNRSQYLNHLGSWVSAFSQSPQNYSPSTGATRAPGAYSATWDGSDVNGAPVSPGDYVLYVEAAREHGPHSITSTPITLNGSLFTVNLSDSGELTGLSASVKV